MCIISEAMYLCHHSTTTMKVCANEELVFFGPSTAASYSAEVVTKPGIFCMDPDGSGGRSLRCSLCRFGEVVFNGKKKDELCPKCEDKRFRKWCVERRRRRISMSRRAYRREMMKRAKDEMKGGERQW